MNRKSVICSAIWAGVLFAPLFNAVLAVEFTGRVRCQNVPVKGAFVVSADDKDRLEIEVTDQKGRFRIKQKKAPFHVVSAMPFGKGTRQDFTYYEYMQQNRLILPEDRKKIILDYNLVEAGNLVLLAYDRKGRLMRKNDFLRQGRFGDQYMFATDLGGESTAALPSIVHDQAGREKDRADEFGIPTMLVPLGQSVAVHFLFWEVENAGKFWLEMNPDGNGYRFTSKGELKAILVNHALAVTHHRKLRRRLEQMGDPAISERIRPDLHRVNKLLAKIETLDTESAKARISDEALSGIIRMRETVELLKARRDIERNRKGQMSLHLKQPNGEPLIGSTVAYRQITHDYMFGVSEILTPGVIRKCKDIGINHALFMPIMNAIQGSPGAYGFKAVDDHFNVNHLFNETLRIKVHGMMYFLKEFIPGFYHGRPYGYIRKNLEEHLKHVILRYRNDVDIWEAVNEPSTTNPLEFSRAQMLDLVKQSSEAIRKYAPGKKVLINDAGEFDFGLKYLCHNEFGLLRNSYNTSFYQFLKELTRRGDISYDIIGLQFYPGFYLDKRFNNLRGPAMDLGWYSDYLDQYAEFGKEIHLTEFSVPSRKGDGMNGWWRRPWNPEVQAEYLAAVYTITFSKPNVTAITWWNATDKEAFVVSGGLLDPAEREKPAFSTLRDLLAQWTSRGSGKTDENGCIRIRGYGGKYRATVSINNSKQQIHFSIKERETRREEINILHGEKQ